MHVTNLTFRDMGHAELGDDLSHKFVLLFMRDLKLETSGECESLTDSEGREENIVLHNVSSKLLEGLFVNRDLVVEKDVAGERGACRRSHSISQNIQ